MVRATPAGYPGLDSVVATARSLPLTTRPRASAGGMNQRLRNFVPEGGTLVVGLLLATPLAMLVVNSFNVAPVGQPARFGMDNWTAALSDPTAFAALVNSFELSLTRTGISLPIALVLTWLITR